MRGNKNLIVFTLTTKLSASFKGYKNKSGAFSFDGKILSVSEGGLCNHKTYRTNSKKLVYLCGSDKFDMTGQFVSLTLDDIDYFVSNENLPQETTDKYKNTTFICTK